MGLIAAHAFKFPFLDHAQDFGLGGQLHIPDFVQKETAFIRFLQLAFFARCGSGESAFFKTKEFAFDQFAGDGRAVELHESLV
ncbi:hypothetical protein DSECCO2_438850 [anaerobic digester metagenome]